MTPIQSSRAGPFRTKHRTAQLPVTCTPLATYQGIIWLPARTRPRPRPRQPSRAPAKPAPAPQARQPRDERRDGAGRDGRGADPIAAIPGEAAGAPLAAPAGPAALNSTHLSRRGGGGLHGGDVSLNLGLRAPYHGAEPGRPAGTRRH